MTIKSFIHHILPTHLAVSIVLLLSISAEFTHAQDEDFEDLVLNGMSTFVQLRKEYYIGALYLESLSSDAEVVTNTNNKKRIDIRITIDKWSARRFAQQWNQLILINNEQQSLEEFADQILAFIDMPEKGFIQGDRITIDTDPDQGTTVYLNGHKVFTENNNDFFNIFLNTWIGQRPPSTSFKDNILTLPTGQAGTDILVQYESTKYTDKRKKNIISWFKSKPIITKTRKNDNDIAIAPPSSDTAVTAKREKTVVEPESKQQNTNIGKIELQTPKPEINFNKPSLVTTTSKAIAAVKAAPIAKKNKDKEVVTAILNTKQIAVEKKKEEEYAEFIKSYRIGVLNRTNRNIVYPRRAMSMRQQDVITLMVTINRKGEVLEIQEPNPSKYRLLSRTTKSAVKKSSPFDEFPSDIDNEKIDIKLEVNFKL